MYAKLFVFLFASVLLVILGNHQSSFAEALPTIDSKCMQCLCEAASGCNLTLGCDGDHCGPFHIPQAYWASTRSLVQPGKNSNNFNAFSNCAKDLKCARKIMESFMGIHRMDYNRDKRIDCKDFLLMHYYEGMRCHRKMICEFGSFIDWEERYNSCNLSKSDDNKILIRK